MLCRRIGSGIAFGLSALAVLVVWAADNTAQAEYTVTLSEVGSNVVANGSGSLDLADLVRNSSGLETGSAIIGPSSGTIVTGPVSATVEDIYEGYVGPAAFGSGNFTPASTGSGDLAGIDALVGYIYVPNGYVSGTVLSAATDTWTNKTFADLGVTPGTYTWTWGSGVDADSFVLNIEAPVAVPEPASLSIFGLALLSLVALRHRHRKVV